MFTQASIPTFSPRKCLLHVMTPCDVHIEPVAFLWDGPSAHSYIHACLDTVKGQSLTALCTVAPSPALLLRTLTPGGLSGRQSSQACASPASSNTTSPTAGLGTGSADKQGAIGCCHSIQKLPFLISNGKS